MIARTFCATVALMTLGLTACSELREDVERPTGPESGVHPEGWTDPSAKESFHGESIRDAGWDMSGCRSCHGADYAGGVAQTSCNTCHAQTPEGCGVCHGSSGSAAPPEDTRGNEETSAVGVGAHNAHVDTSGIASALACSECHAAISAFAAPAHIDGDGRAEIEWGQLARTGTAAPRYDPENATCAGTYCHGGGRFGSGREVVWTEVGAGAAACSTCHGLPPAPGTGHPQVADPIPCSLCHASVGQDLGIVARELHLNGQTDVRCGTCHLLPPAAPHLQNVTCSQCHGGVIGPEYEFLDANRHNNGQVDFF